jgi:hypothetical protein
MPQRPRKAGGEEPGARKAPWRGRVRVADPKDKFVMVRLSVPDHARLTEAAHGAGLSLAAFVRKTALGDAGPRAKRRATATTVQLSLYLAELGKMGSNLNQIARWANIQKQPPGGEDIKAIRRGFDEIKAKILTVFDAV